MFIKVKSLGQEVAINTDLLMSARTHAIDRTQVMFVNGMTMTVDCTLQEFYMFMTNHRS